MLLLFCFADVIGQPEKSPIFIEHNTIIADSGQSEIISYRVPYKNLLFVRNDDIYNASFTLTFEFYKDDEFVLREILNPSLSTKNYDETLSKKKFYQDYVELNILPGSYTLKTILGLSSTEIEYKIPDQKIVIDSLKDTTLQEPIIVTSDFTVDKKSFVLANYGNLIPYSPNKFDLLFGISHVLSDSATVTISQNKKNIFSNEISKLTVGGLEIEKNNKELVLSINDSSTIKYFLISNFSNFLYEGSAELKIKIDTVERTYTLNTNWIDKPKVLNNHEYSIKLLSYIEDDFVVGDLLSLNEDKYYTALTEHWIEKYPANGMKYNYAMQEYYSRADYAIKNYSSLNSYDGAERDRGKIYILFGEPTTKERNYTEMNEILEVWKYADAGRTFVFKDINGTGKFDIVK